MKQQQTKRTSQGPETTKVCGIKTAGLTTPYCQTLSGTGICRQISCQLIRYTECEGKREAKNSDENDCSYSDPTWVPVGSTTWPATVCYIHCYDACKCHCQKHNEVSKCQHICGSQVAGAKDQLTRSCYQVQQKWAANPKLLELLIDMQWLSLYYPLDPSHLQLLLLPQPRKETFFFTFFLLNMNAQNLEKNQKKVITTSTTTIKPKCTKPWEKTRSSHNVTPTSKPKCKRPWGKKNTEESSHHNNDNKPKTAQNLERETEEIITTKQN